MGQISRHDILFLEIRSSQTWLHSKTLSNLDYKAPNGRMPSVLANPAFFPHAVLSATALTGPPGTCPAPLEPAKSQLMIPF